MCRDGDDVQRVDSSEVRWVDCEEREVVCDGDRRDQGVVGAGRGFPSVLMQARGDTSEAPSCCGVERQWVEVGFGLLHVGLTVYALGFRSRHEGTD